MGGYGYEQQMMYQPQYSRNQYQNSYSGYAQSQPMYANAYQQQQYAQPTFLNGQMVDSLEVARAKDVDMSGNANFYPNINGKEIYRKQLQPDGTCPTFVYRLVDPSQGEKPTVNEDELPINEKSLNVALDGFKQSLLDEIRSMISEPPKPTRGGAK